MRTVGFTLFSMDCGRLRPAVPGRTLPSPAPVRRLPGELPPAACRTRSTLLGPALVSGPLPDGWKEDRLRHLCPFPLVDKRLFACPSLGLEIRKEHRWKVDTNGVLDPMSAANGPDKPPGDGRVG